jgi:hypothetical protein
MLPEKKAYMYSSKHTGTLPAFGRVKGPQDLVGGLRGERRGEGGRSGVISSERPEDEIGYKARK